jgi:molybdopterin/thiamine biosynthesis adenylyltransferase
MQINLENVRTAMALLGLSREEAQQKLATKIHVSACPEASALQRDVVELIERTFVTVASDGRPDLELAIGIAPQSNARTNLILGSSMGCAEIVALPNEVELAGYIAMPGLTRRVVACYSAAVISAHALGVEQLSSMPSPFRITYADLGLDLALLSAPLVLNDAVLIGAGGVANGFLWGLQELNVSGELLIIDPKTVQPGNLNRCLFFTKGDLGDPKAEALAGNAIFERLTLRGKQAEFSNVLSEMRVELAISTVDSRRVRRSIQRGLPFRVVDASTTDVTAVVTHSNRQPASGACLGCIYPHVPEEDTQARDVAAALGITLDEVKRDFISEETALKIHQRYGELAVLDLIGKSTFSLFRQKCGEGSLKTPAGKQVLAPLAFVSNLAGVLLALELMLQEHDPNFRSQSNYMTLDPWRPPFIGARRTRPRISGCEVCADSDVIAGYRVLWPELFGLGLGLPYQL